jgi:hypothetical protein
MQEQLRGKLLDKLVHGLATALPMPVIIDDQHTARL